MIVYCVDVYNLSTSINFSSLHHFIEFNLADLGDADKLKVKAIYCPPPPSHANKTNSVNRLIRMRLPGCFGPFSALHSSGELMDKRV